MNKCTTVLLTLSLLFYGDSFAMDQKKAKGKKPAGAQCAVWPSPAEAAKISNASGELKSQFEHTKKLGEVLAAIPTASATLKQTDVQQSPHATLRPVLTAINSLHDSRRMGTGLHVAQAQARALSHPEEYKKHVVPNITESARASLKPVSVNVVTPAAATPATAQDADMSELFAELTAIAQPAHTQTAPVIPTAEELAAATGYNNDNDDAPPAPDAPAPVEQEVAIVATEVPAVQTVEAAPSCAPAPVEQAITIAEATPAPAQQETATVTTDVVSTVENAPAPVTAQVTPKTASKPSYITAMMKLACVRSTNLAKALYFLQNTANRDDLTRKEIGSRLGDAIPETIAALNQIRSKYDNSKIQSSDEITRLQEPLVKGLETALKLAIHPEEVGEKQIQVDTSMLKMAVKELQKLNRHQKHQVKQVVVKATELAQRNKSLAFLIQDNMESRGDHLDLDDALSEDEYNTTDDMLTSVHNETHANAQAEDTK